MIAISVTYRCRVPRYSRNVLEKFAASWSSARANRPYTGDIKITGRRLARTRPPVSSSQGVTMRSRYRIRPSARDSLFQFVAAYATPSGPAIAVINFVAPLSGNKNATMNLIALSRCSRGNLTTRGPVCTLTGGKLNDGNEIFNFTDVADVYYVLRDQTRLNIPHGLQFLSTPRHTGFLTEFLIVLDTATVSTCTRCRSILVHFSKDQSTLDFNSLKKIPLESVPPVLQRLVDEFVRLVRSVYI